MKRTLGILTAGVALGLAAYYGGRALAQGQQQPAAGYQRQPTAPAQPQSKIAVVNLLSVIKNYKKCENCEAELKKQYQDADGRMEEKRKMLVNYKTQADNPQTPVEQRANLERQFKAVQREMDDLKEELNQKLTKSRGETAVTLYREIENAVLAYARAYGIELVLHYNDAVVPSDLYNPMNIQRKMQGGGCTPMYIAPGLDITASVVQMLNQAYAGTPRPQAPRGN